MTGSSLELLYSPASRHSWALPPCQAFCVHSFWCVPGSHFLEESVCVGEAAPTPGAAVWLPSEGPEFSETAWPSLCKRWKYKSYIPLIIYQWLYCSLSLLGLSSRDPSSMGSALLWLWGGGMRQITYLGPLWVWIPWSWTVLWRCCATWRWTSPWKLSSACLSPGFDATFPFGSQEHRARRRLHVSLIFYFQRMIWCFLSSFVNHHIIAFLIILITLSMTEYSGAMWWSCLTEDQLSWIYRPCRRLTETNIRIFLSCLIFCKFTISGLKTWILQPSSFAVQLALAAQIPCKHLLSFDGQIGSEFANWGEVMKNETVSSQYVMGAARRASSQWLHVKNTWMLMVCRV